MINIIVAIGENNEIGANNDLLWHLGDDLKNFKKLTKGKVVIMGQKTYESLPIKPLPNRTNIIITDDPDIQYDNCVMAYDIKDSIEKANYWSDDNDIFVIGGGSIYKQFINLVDNLYITKVHSIFKNADRFFPKINENKWKIVFIENYKKDENNEFDYSFMKYEKI